jgi:BirA family biotin operon repressor/biotin-[acetyl-CoA-carboxylase] ligase
MKYEIIPGSGVNGAGLHILESVDSTNRWALEHLSALRDGDVICAGEQTNGHGRFGRPWFSPAGTCLTLTWVLVPASADDPLARWPCQVAALAAARYISRAGIPARIRWPNDVLVAGRKIAGALAETASAATGIAVGLGLNVNVTTDQFASPGLREQATSLLIETGRVHALDLARTELLNCLSMAAQSARQNGISWLLREWKSLDCLAGTAIRLTTPSGEISGCYAGPNENMELLVDLPDGTRKSFNSGDVTLVRGVDAPPAR